jgi:hypothetical protein
MTGFLSAQKAVAVTPTDTAGTVFSACDALWIGVGGTITFIPADPAIANGTATAVATTVPAGVFPVKAVRVAATGTAATGIVALYSA